jgi:hypothetical protein
VHRIEIFVPRPRDVDVQALHGLDADLLAAYVADPTHPWWRRRACADALAGRVPERWIGELAARVRDGHGEVCIALLSVLADLDVAAPQGLLAWLRDEAPHDRRFGVADAALAARGRLGDRTAVPGLAVLAASPWARVRTLGEVGLDALVARHGVGSVLGELSDDRPEDRVCAVRLRRRERADVTAALADPDRTVAYLAAQDLGAEPDRVRRFLDEEAPTLEARLWAAYALHRVTGDEAETRAIHDRLGRPRVEVAGLDEEARSAIVHQYASRCEWGSDPRWRVEAICSDAPARPDQEEQLRRALAAMLDAGFAPEPPISAGEANAQGGGTYHVIRCGEDTVLVSTLGRFVRGEDDESVARLALEEAGFRWIDAATGAVRVEGLCVYYFGEREPLTVDTLLFYWQD